MLIELCDVPRRERHLLYCTTLKEIEPSADPALRHGRHLTMVVPAINRSLSIHGESVDRTWSAGYRDPTTDAPVAA